MHLRSALTIAGHVIAPAGTRTALRIVSTRKAVAPDINGDVQVQFEPLRLADGAVLPIRATHEFWNITLTAGQTSTGALMDAAEDILIPGHVIYRAFRRGRNISLKPGTIVRGLTTASVALSAGDRAVIETPPPFAIGVDAPHSDVTPVPLATVTASPTPRPKPTPAPKSAASPPNTAPKGKAP